MIVAEYCCPRCGSEEWKYIDYGGCSVCRPYEERHTEDDDDIKGVMTMGVHDIEEYDKIKKALSIPEDEPIFILRAQDKLSVPTIARYQVMAHQVEEGPNEEWHAQISTLMEQFIDWQQANPTKVPD